MAKDKSVEKWIVRVSTDNRETWKNLSNAFHTCGEAMRFAEEWKNGKSKFPCYLKVSKLIEFPHLLWNVT